MAAAARKKKTFWENTVEIVILLTIVFLIRTWGFGLYQVPTGSMETTMLVGDRFFADKFSYLIRDPQRGEVISFNEPPVSFNYSKNPFWGFWQKYIYGPNNWTKRIIGMPGDTLRGVIEDGKAVIYVNGKKLDEPYLNKYPLIKVCKIEPHLLDRKIRSEVAPFLWRGVDKNAVEEMRREIYRANCSPKSYDPSKSFEDQPFYRMKSSHVVRDERGLPELKYPDIAERSSYDREETDDNYWDGSDEFSIKLGIDEYWVMGDNRKGSHDSRFFGPIKRNLIHGHILFRIWSLDSDEAWWIFDLIKHPIDFWSRVHWSRFFNWIY